MKNALLASVALACMAFAVPASAQTAQQEAPGRPAQTQKAPGAMKPEATPAPHQGGAALEKARPESGAAAEKREEKAGAAARGAEKKADERPALGAGDSNKPATAEKKPDMPKANDKAERPGDKDKSTAQGREPTRDNDKAQGRADRSRPGDDDKAGKATMQGRDNARSDERNGERTGDRVNANASVNIDERQRSRLTTYFEKHRGPRVDRVDFNISVGVRIPTRVRVAPVPREIIEIVPEYRGYDYVMVRDEIVILRPRTREIVTVIPASTSAAARGAKLDPCGNRS